MLSLELCLFFELCSYVIPGIILRHFEKNKASLNQIINVIIKILFIDITSRYFVYQTILKYNNVSYDILNFNFKEFLILLTIYTIFQDIIFHIIHVVIHHESLYGLIHEMHHRSELTDCSSILGKYMSVYDFLVFACFTNILKILIFTHNIKYMILIDIIDYLGTLYSHSGIISKSLNYHHYAHHKYLKCNYGMTPLSDWLFGTLKVEIQ